MTSDRLGHQCMCSDSSVHKQELDQSSCFFRSHNSNQHIFVLHVLKITPYFCVDTMWHKISVKMQKVNVVSEEKTFSEDCPTVALSLTPRNTINTSWQSQLLHVQNWHVYFFHCRFYTWIHTRSTLFEVTVAALAWTTAAVKSTFIKSESSWNDKRSEPKSSLSPQDLSPSPDQE